MWNLALISFPILCAPKTHIFAIAYNIYIGTFFTENMLFYINHVLLVCLQIINLLFIFIEWYWWQNETSSGLASRFTSISWKCWYIYLIIENTYLIIKYTSFYFMKSSFCRKSFVETLFQFHCFIILYFHASNITKINHFTHKIYPKVTLFCILVYAW